MALAGQLMIHWHILIRHMSIVVWFICGKMSSVLPSLQFTVKKVIEEENRRGGWIKLSVLLSAKQQRVI